MTRRSTNGPSAGAVARAAGLVALIATMNVACRPLYIPLVPETTTTPTAPTAATRLGLGADSALTWSQNARRLELRLSLSGIEEAGWLAVQWFSPGGAQVASESVWIDISDGSAGSRESSLLVLSPADIEISQGEWRAVVSWGGVLLRQFRAVVPAGEADD